MCIVSKHLEKVLGVLKNVMKVLLLVQNDCTFFFKEEEEKQTKQNNSKKTVLQKNLFHM